MAGRGTTRGFSADVYVGFAQMRNHRISLPARCRAHGESANLQVAFVSAAKRISYWLASV